MSGVESGLKAALDVNKSQGGLIMEKAIEMPIRIDRVMELTGYSKSYIHKLVCWKKLPCHKPTNGRLFFLESEIIEFLSQGKRSADYELSKKAEAMLNGEAAFKKTKR
jgi:predicted DNA-binding transcriptional regulator AlpA